MRSSRDGGPVERARNVRHDRLRLATATDKAGPPIKASIDAEAIAITP